MTIRDASRIRIYFPDIDIDGDGSAADENNDFHACVTGNVSWSGFTRQSTKTTCTESTVDTWGNIVHTYRAGAFIELGTLTFDVDWDADDDAGVYHAAFRNKQNRNYQIKFPAESGETTGPIITIPGHFVGFTPITNAMSEGDDARARATLQLKISGDWTITDAT